MASGFVLKSGLDINEPPRVSGAQAAVAPARLKSVNVKSDLLPPLLPSINDSGND
jgi:hypothetical protein